MGADQQTTTALYVCTFVALGLITIRLVIRLWLREKFTPDDYLMGASSVPLLARLGLIHFILIYGTNNMSDKARERVFSETEIHRREVASKMLLANRVFYNTFLWMMKCCLLIFYRTLTRNLPKYEQARKFIWVSIIISYIAINIATFVECKPFRYYYQVVPDPGDCSRAVVQLFVLGVLNVITDAFLIVFPMPAIWKAHLYLAKKISLLVLFCVGFFVVSVTIIRLPQNYEKSTVQINRTLWASVEAVAACFVANAAVLYKLFSTLKRTRKRMDTSYAGSTPNESHGDNDEERLAISGNVNDTRDVVEPQLQGETIRIAIDPREKKSTSDLEIGVYGISNEDLTFGGNDTLRRQK